jgi:hypothetical protein
VPARSSTSSARSDSGSPAGADRVAVALGGAGRGEGGAGAGQAAQQLTAVERERGVYSTAIPGCTGRKIPQRAGTCACPTAVLGLVTVRSLQLQQRPHARPCWRCGLENELQQGGIAGPRPPVWRPSLCRARLQGPADPGVAKPPVGIILVTTGRHFSGNNRGLCPLSSGRPFR